MIDRKSFFAALRPTLFGGRLTAAQVAGITAILDEWERRRLTDLRFLAYMLATVYHETARTMAPIAEYGRGRGRAYGVPDPASKQTYYGRGFVQLTWRRNYEAMGRILGLDLVNHPDKALELPIAVAILFEGMLRGSFTGVKLADHFNPRTDDPVGARRIVNGTDKAVTIAGYHRIFLAALRQAATPRLAPATPESPTVLNLSSILLGAVEAAVAKAVPQVTVPLSAEKREATRAGSAAAADPVIDIAAVTAAVVEGVKRDPAFAAAAQVTAPLPWWRSPVTIGSAVATVVPLLGLFGYSLSPDDQQAVVAVLTATATAIAGLVSLIARLRSPAQPVLLRAPK